MTPTLRSLPSANVADLLHATAQTMPDRMAVAEPRGRDRHGKRQYRQVTFRQLDEDCARLAAGLQALGVEPGTRLVLMVRPGIEFISLVFAMFRAGAVIVLVDPGMGRANMMRCLETVEPEGFIAIPLVQALRAVLRHRFPQSRFHVTVGRRWFWGGETLDSLRARTDRPPRQPVTDEASPAAIIYTTGSTGPPKGVLYLHRNFIHQAREIQQAYGIQPGEIDLPGFPLFALFNCAMGVSTVIPDMDPTRPADVDPRKIVEAVRDWNVTQAFGSPALWNVVGRYCESQGIQLETVRRVLAAGAPVPPHVLRRVKQAIHADGDLHTPYGATEALPVATISASQLLAETVAATEAGRGTCVGTRYPGIEWKVIRIRDDALADIEQVEELERGEIGELMVTGPVVTRQYVAQPQANALHKVRDGQRIWHRMGDVGYLDAEQRFWFCGRKTHRVQTCHGTLYTVMCEAIFNRHPAIYRSALVGVGSPPRQTPVLIAEPWRDRRPGNRPAEATLVAQLQELAAEFPHTASIRHILIHPALPVDIRHNAKIFRERLAPWAAARIKSNI